MAIDCILAMVPAEILANATLPPKIGWMSCHFSPCSTGLSNLPNAIPPGSLLIVDDWVPFQNHDPGRILAQLQEVWNCNDWSGLLLDFQRPGDPGTAEIVQAVMEAFPDMVTVSQAYGEGLQCPIFLPPVPLDVALPDYLRPWQGREIWLDISTMGQAIRLTSEGASATPLPYENQPESAHREPRLHCHYRIQVYQDRAEFTLFRTGEDLSDLLTEAKTLGVVNAVGLWQELSPLLA